jgi:hypothetical protein
VVGREKYECREVLWGYSLESNDVNDRLERNIWIKKRGKEMKITE